MIRESVTLRNVLLPREAPTVTGYDVAGGTSTHEEGHGDTLWDHFELRDGRRGFTVLKAGSGSLPAGFYLGMGRALMRGLAPTHDSVEGLLASVNKTLAAGAPEASHQVLDCGVVLPTEDGVEWCIAGSALSGVIGRDGSFVELGSNGPPLGMMEGFQYRSNHHPMSVGDSCVTLSHASSGLFKGTADLVAGLVGKPAGEVVSTVHKAIRQAQGDDAEVSVLFLRRG